MSFKRTCISIFSVCCLLLLYDFVDRQFRFANVTEEWVGKVDIPLNSEDESQLSNLFQDPFVYLDRGRQSFVFASSDGRTVLKFFDLKRYRKGWRDYFSSSSESRMKRKKERLFQGYELAYERDRDHAGILFQQLSTNSAFNQTVTLQDRFGVIHTIDLGKVPFVLQLRGVQTREELSSLLSFGDVKTAKLRLRQLVDMYVDEYRQGIYDRDHNFMYNTGFVANKPIRLDVGRLTEDDQVKQVEIALQDLEKIAIERTDGWMQRHFPAYRDEIVLDMNKKINEIGLQSVMD